MKKCLETEISISGEELKAIEKDTRDQSSGAAFFRHRAGRIGASQSFSVAQTNPAQPAQTLIKSICYPQLFKFNNSAVNHGHNYEEKAVAAYTNVMSENHKDFKVTKCGGFIDQTQPWLHADFLCTCSCCGDGCGELKCPYSIQNWDFESYLLKESSCLEKVDGMFKLKRNHDYFYQVQQQLSITGSKYCDFVVCAFNNNKPIFFMEGILPDPNHWETVVPKLTKVWRTCVLPELLVRWYTRKQHAPSLTLQAHQVDLAIVEPRPKKEPSIALIQSVLQRNFTTHVYKCQTLFSRSGIVLTAACKRNSRNPEGHRKLRIHHNRTVKS